ncbi:MAG: hypothetical protein AAF602_00675 [Myxococcota bacterium]
MWAVAVVLAATMAAFLGFALWQSRLITSSVRRRCTVCGGEREIIEPPPGRHRTYDVVACSHCTDVAVSVQGQPSRFAVCPSCSQFGLEVEATALAPREVGSVPPIEVEEHCRICGYRDEWGVPDLVDELPNNVIEFPRR